MRERNGAGFHPLRSLGGCDVPGVLRPRSVGQPHVGRMLAGAYMSGELWGPGGARAVLMGMTPRSLSLPECPSPNSTARTTADGFTAPFYFNWIFKPCPGPNMGCYCVGKTCDVGPMCPPVVRARARELGVPPFAAGEPDAPRRHLQYTVHPGPFLALASGAPPATDEPTSQPSIAPSTSSSVSPSGTPSAAPSGSPTAAPSSSPTGSPSAAPSTFPTQQPGTAMPTQVFHIEQSQTDEEPVL